MHFLAILGINMRILPQIYVAEWSYLQDSVMKTGDYQQLLTIDNATFRVVTKDAEIKFENSMLFFIESYLKSMVDMLEDRYTTCGVFDPEPSTRLNFCVKKKEDKFSVYFDELYFCELNQFTLITGAIECAQSVDTQVEYLYPRILENSIYQLRKIKEKCLIEKLNGLLNI